MAKEEQLKIYSAYLPYGLKFRFCHGCAITIMELHSVCFEKGVVNDNVYLDPQNIEPYLYPLEYLTREIEHEDKKIIPIEIIKLCCDEAHFKYIERFIYFEDSVSILPWWVIELLLEWHFNVFNLTEDQYINKATLTNK